MFKGRTLKRQEARAREFAAQREELRRTPLGEQQLWVHVLGAPRPPPRVKQGGSTIIAGRETDASSWPKSVRSPSTGSARALHRPREHERQPHGRRPGGLLRLARCARSPPPERGPAPRGIISRPIARATLRAQARCR